jgi:hypothetical protein
MTLRRLKGLDAVHVNQGDVHKPICLGIDDRNPVLANRDDFGMADLIGFAVGKPQFKRLERAPAQPFADRFGIHRFAVGKNRFVTPANYITAADAVASWRPVALPGSGRRITSALGHAIGDILAACRRVHKGKGPRKETSTSP